MTVWRRIPAFLGLAIFLLNDGNCINLVFADQQAKDCCAKGHCSKSSKSDPCCQTIPPSAIQYFRPEARIAADSPAMPVVAMASANPRIPIPDFGIDAIPRGVPLRSPPDPAVQTALPL